MTLALYKKVQNDVAKEAENDKALNESSSYPVRYNDQDLKMKPSRAQKEKE